MIPTEIILSVLGIVLIVLNVTFAVTIIFFERRDIGSTWAWLLVLFFIPLLGFFIYIFFGRLIKSNNFYQVDEERRHEYAKHVDDQLTGLDAHDGLFAHDPLLSKYRRLARLNLSSTNALVTYHNAIQVIHDGEQKFEALFHDIEMTTSFKTIRSVKRSSRRLHAGPRKVSKYVCFMTPSARGGCDAPISNSSSRTAAR